MKSHTRWFFLIGLAALLIAVAYHLSKEPYINSSVRFTAPAEIYDSGDCGGKVIRTAQAGQAAQVLSYGYPKDCMYFKIRFDDGMTGYVYNGEMFEVLKAGKTISAAPPRPLWPLKNLAK